MMLDNIVLINIQYKLEGQDIWMGFNLPPHQYFDLDDGEDIEFDSIPMYEHAIDYIKDNVEKVVATKITISNEGKRSKRIITTTYWNEQKNSITERVDLSEGNMENEIIIETRISDTPSIYEIMRVIRRDDTLVPIYHGFITDCEDGSQQEEKII